MKYISLLTIFVFLVIIINSCWRYKDDYPNDLTIKNLSNATIYYGVSCSYPDTDDFNNIIAKPLKNNGFYKIRSMDSSIFRTRFLIFNPVAQIFIFDADVIEKVPWDSISKNYMVLRRYQFTEDSLKKWNWEIFIHKNKASEYRGFCFIMRLHSLRRSL